MDAYTQAITTRRRASSVAVFGPSSLENPGSGDLVPMEIFRADPPDGERQADLLETVQQRFLDGHARRALDLLAGPETRIGNLPDVWIAGVAPTAARVGGNRRLAEWIVRDLNADPTLPYPDEAFDTVLCSLDVGTLTHPIETFREASRVLAPGGLFLVTYGAAFYAADLTRMWALGDDFDHITLVESYFSFSEAFTRSRSMTAFFAGDGIDWYLGGLPPDSGVRHYLFATWGHKGRESAVHAARPPFPDRARIESKTREDVRFVEGGRPVCPHCGTLTEPIAPPVTPFEIDYGADRLYVCFNDACEYHQSSKSWMRRQGRPNTTYRFSFNPDNGSVGPILDNLFHGLASSRIEE